LVRLIVVSEERRDEYQPLLLDCLAAAESHDVEVEGILGNEANVQVLVATTEVMRSCTDTVTNQGMVALVRIPTAADIDERQEPGLNTASSLHVVLDGLQDPGNVGTLVRSCVATGVAWLWVLPPSADVWGPKALRSAMGLTFALPVQTHIASFQECVEFLCRDFGCRRIYAATMEDSVAMQSSSSESSNTPVSVPHYQVNWAEETGAAALVIGGEGSGLSDEVRQALRDRPDLVRAVHVPMLAGVESLNAGVCGSVILFEYLRQHQQRIHHQQPSLSVPITAHELSPTPSGESQ
jgi:TrmH family RNA methyltransferase